MSVSTRYRLNERNPILGRETSPSDRLLCPPSQYLHVPIHLRGVVFGHMISFFYHMSEPGKLPQRYRAWSSFERYMVPILDAYRVSCVRVPKVFHNTSEECSYWTLTDHNCTHTISSSRRSRSNFIDLYCKYLPVTVAVRSEAWVLAGWLVGSWVRSPLKARMFVRVFLCCVVLCRYRPCDWLITRPRSSTICLNSSRNLYVRRPRSFKDCRATGKIVNI
jgi:hypothetical protein